MASDYNALRKLNELIKYSRVTMMTTIREDGMPNSRPMATQQMETDGDLWFFTSASSHKVDEVTNSPKVNVSFADPDKQRYVSVTGVAQMVRDREKIDELWRPQFKIWFPKGKDDPEIALLRVSLEKAEYWDSPGSTIAYALSFASSLVTGQRPDLGENKKVDLQ